MGFNIHILSVRNRSTNLPGHAALAPSFNPQPSHPFRDLVLGLSQFTDEEIGTSFSRARGAPEGGAPLWVAFVVAAAAGSGAGLGLRRNLRLQEKLDPGQRAKFSAEEIEQIQRAVLARGVEAGRGLGKSYEQRQLARQNCES
jgi:hypothetical protein